MHACQHSEFHLLNHPYGEDLCMKYLFRKYFVSNQYVITMLCWTGSVCAVGMSIVRKCEPTDLGTYALQVISIQAEQTVSGSLNDLGQLFIVHLADGSIV